MGIYIPPNNAGGGHDLRVAWEACPANCSPIVMGDLNINVKHPRDERESALADLLDEIVAAVRAQSSWPEWTKDGGQFIPHAATWLNARRWEDERPGPVASPVRAALKRETDAFMAEQRERDRLLADPNEQARIAEVMARRIKAVA